MAARLRKRPVLDVHRDAVARLQAANIAIARHLTGCGQCVRAGHRADQGCDAGWELAKMRARAQAAVRAAVESDAAKPVQELLW